jgi:polygalacturonase
MSGKSRSWWVSALPAAFRRGVCGPHALRKITLVTALVTWATTPGICTDTTTSARGEGDWAEASAIVARIHAPTFPAHDYDVIGYGAPDDGTKDALPALRAAIAACHDGGGGRVVVPAGNYLLKGPIHLLSGVDLHVAAGATLRFSGEPADFLPLVVTRWEGTLLYNYSPLIYARGAENIAVTGGGVIDGQARLTFTGWLAQQTPAQERLRQMGADGTPIADRQFGAGSFLRPGMFEPFECKNVLIEGVTLRDSPFWVVHPIFCSNVTVRGVTVDSLALNNDGCDPDSCTDVLIENCTFHTGDDGIAIKAGRDADAWRDGRKTENVVIRQCRFQSKINGLCIGSEMSAGVRNVFMEDCHVEAGESCIYFKSNRDRGGFIEHVRVRRVQIDASRSAVIRFETNYHSYRGGNAPTVFRDFVIEDVTCAAADAYFMFADGLADAPIADVRLQNVIVAKAAEPLFLRAVERLTLTDVIVNGQKLSEHPQPTPAKTPRLKMKM